jgi:hypothetical protein
MHRGARAHMPMLCTVCARYTLRVCVCKCAALRRARLAQAIAPLDRRRVGSLRHSWTAHARARAAVCARTLWKWKPGRLAPVRCGQTGNGRREAGGRPPGSVASAGCLCATEPSGWMTTECEMPRACACAGQRSPTSELSLRSYGPFGRLVRSTAGGSAKKLRAAAEHRRALRLLGALGL